MEDCDSNLEEMNTHESILIPDILDHSQSREQTSGLSENERFKMKIPKYGFCDLFVNIVSFLLFIFDIIVDIRIVYGYYVSYKLYKIEDHQSFYWFVLTLLFVITSGILISIYSAKCLWDDYKKGKEKYSNLEWIIIIIIHCLLLGSIYRFLRCLSYSRKATCNKDNEFKKSNSFNLAREENDLALIFIIEGFTESVPQLILQLYILSAKNQLVSEDDILIKELNLKPDFIHKWQYTKVFISLMSICWILVAFQQKNRTAQGLKNLSKTSFVIVFFSNIFIIFPRVIALAVFATYSISFLFSVIIGHWIIMFIWFYYCEMKEDFKSFLSKTFITLIISYTNIFCIFIIHFGEKRYSYIFCTTCLYIENIILILVWYFNLRSDIWYSLAGIVFISLGFWIGMILLYTHYNSFHPSIKYSKSDKVNIMYNVLSGSYK